MKKIAFVFCCVLLFVACDLTPKVYLRSYVERYYDVETIHAVLITQNRIALSIYDENGGHDYITYIDSGSQNEDKQLYDDLCRKHNDMSYNRCVYTPGNDPSVLPWYFIADFVLLDISSNSDYDADYLADESLADIIMFHSVSPVPYIDSKYKDKFNWDEANDIELEIRNTMGNIFGDKTEVHPIYKLVSMLTTSDMTLMGTGDVRRLAYLTFTQQPTLSKEHTLTITLTADDGRVFTDTVEITFE